MATLRLISFDLCPYVQRSAIALQEKGLAYEITYIDLAAKPDWFLAISPHGKVPLLQVDETVLFESTVILEYLDETCAPRLHPDDPLQRARDRAWFSVADAAAVDVYQMMVAKDRETLEVHAGKLKARLAQLEPELVGPCWRGDRLSAMDAVAYPALQRARWLNELHPQLDLFSATPGVDRWERAMAERPAVRASTVPDIRERFFAALPRYGAVHRDSAAG